MSSYHRTAPSSASKLPKIQLVLGSGGARGMAHIGVINELQARGYEIVEVVGCSMGSVVGGLFCAGQLKAYEDWLRTLSRSGVFKLMDFTLSGNGFVKGEKVFERIQKMTGKLLIEDFPIPFTSIATDMASMTEIRHTSGDLYHALRCSVSIPGMFTPIIVGDAVMVDGGVLNPLPIDVLAKRDDAIIVAVNLNYQADPQQRIFKDPDEESWISGKLQSLPNLPALPNLPNFPSLSSLSNVRLLSRFSADKSESKTDDDTLYQSAAPSPPVALTNPKDQTKKTEKRKLKVSSLQMMSASYDFTQSELIKMKIALCRPDIVVNVPHSICDTFDYYLANRVIKTGAILIDEALHQYHSNS